MLWLMLDIAKKQRLPRPSGFSRLGLPRLYADDNGGDGNTLDARDANHMTVLRSTHSRVAGSKPPRGDNTRIRNGDSRS